MVDIGLEGIGVNTPFLPFAPAEPVSLRVLEIYLRRIKGVPGHVTQPDPGSIVPSASKIPRMYKKA